MTSIVDPSFLALSCALFDHFSTDQVQVQQPLQTSTEEEILSSLSNFFSTFSHSAALEERKRRRRIAAKDRREKKERSRELSQQRRPLWTCQNCGDKNPHVVRHKYQQGRKSHKLCQSCLRQAFQVFSLDPTVYNQKSLCFYCHSPVPFSFSQKLLGLGLIDHHDLMRLEEQLTLQYLFLTKMLKYCPNPRCSLPVYIEPMEGEIGSPCSFLSCTGCPEAFCLHCGLDLASHRDKTCSEALQAQDFWKWKEEKDQLEEQFKVKRCPSCDKWIEKNEGCNHMTCKCTHEFCWLCLKDWKNHNECIPPPLPAPPVVQEEVASAEPSSWETSETSWADSSVQSSWADAEW